MASDEGVSSPAPRGNAQRWLFCCVCLLSGFKSLQETPLPLISTVDRLALVQFEWPGSSHSHSLTAPPSSPGSSVNATRQLFPSALCAAQTPPLLHRLSLSPAQTLGYAYHSGSSVRLSPFIRQSNEEY